MIYIDTATLSLNSGAKPVEVYVPLWFADGTNIQGTLTSAGGNFIADGTNSPQGLAITASKLFNLSANISIGTKFALEASLFSTNSTTTANVALWDMTSNAIVSGSTISTTATTATVLRSSQFTLTAGHAYGVTLWVNGSYNCAVTSASLIIFP